MYRLVSLFLFTVTFLPGTVFATDDASLLGPAASAGSTGSSTETLNSLQPASPTALQTGGSATGSQSTDQSTLQQTATDQSKLLVQGDFDASDSPTDASSGAWHSLGILITIVIVGGLVVFLARHDLGAASSVPKRRKKHPKSAVVAKS